jgi:hypothetical protein
MPYYCTIEKEGDEYIAQFPDMTNIEAFGQKCAQRRSEIDAHEFPEVPLSVSM